MLLTQNEAAEMPCPRMRHCINGGAVTAFQESPIYEHSKCIACCCPWWRWTKKKQGEPQRGYCGVAGKPEEI